jgi:hypothetical protein
MAAMKEPFGHAKEASADAPLRVAENMNDERIWAFATLK